MTRTYRSDPSIDSGLQRLVAPNPSVMTAAGTNTYILGKDEVAIIDPGPCIDAHLEAIVGAVAGRRVVGLLVTHAHLDHSPAAAPLARTLDAPVMAFGRADAGRSDLMRSLPVTGGGEGVDTGFNPDVTLADDAEIAGADWRLRAIWTPGHMANHLSFHWIEGDAVFTGDTVMGWSSTMISPPDGDLGQYLTTLDRLEALDTERFHPGHGDPVTAPVARCRELRAHRLARESEILAALDRPARISALVARIYASTPPALHRAAARNVLAHLIHLEMQGRVAAEPTIAPDALWHRL
ncbi:MBL fold metallo-hydrolase [uncultured Jannaschia sp.]|uniref:MBL fold metallo-hydrolase n=1 Tax=uncultured Jannaschia sp. TaxID=293347 RepID=UPI002632C32B|nr:MBL fold metallo-hydrolase [uncultured Jannaschia sp.]